MTETDPFEGLRAILAEPNPFLQSAPWVNVHEERPRVRYFDHMWNEVNRRDVITDGSTLEATNARPAWWGWATTDPHRDTPLQWPRQHARRDVLHGPTTFAVLAYIAKKQREDMIANGVEPSLWITVAGRHYIGGWWMTTEAVLEDETRIRLANQARTALAAQ